MSTQTNVTADANRLQHDQRAVQVGANRPFMAMTSYRLDTTMPGGATARGRARPVSTKPLLSRVLAAARRSTSMRQGSHRRPGPADPGAFAACWTAGLTRGASLFVDNRHRR